MSTQPGTDAPDVATAAAGAIGDSRAARRDQGRADLPWRGAIPCTGDITPVICQRATRGRQSARWAGHTATTTSYRADVCARWGLLAFGPNVTTLDDGTAPALIASDSERPELRPATADQWATRSTTATPPRGPDTPSRWPRGPDP